MSSVKHLSETILDDGTRSINWFNGRLVTAEAMNQDRKANREGLRSVARALGDGVGFGLEVSRSVASGSGPVVKVTAGLAINRRGDLLRLCADADLSLLRDPRDETLSPDGFQDCVPAQPGVYVAGEGVYLLVMAPATAKQGRAVVSGLGNVRSGCDAGYVVDGVVFRLVQVPLTQAVLDDVAHLRNVLAYRFFGLGESTAAIKDPFGLAPPSESPLEALRSAKQVNDCDVPLAVLYWTSAGIQFVDMWSVRRRITASPQGSLRKLVGTVRRSRSEARLFQFQEHLADLIDESAQPSALSAREHFRHLPPAGLFPVGGIKGSQGLDFRQFFDGMTYRGPVFMEGTKLAPLLRHSLEFEPIVAQAPELVWLYHTRQNLQPLETGTEPTLQPYLVFANGQTDYRADARFDAAYWNYANYALVGL